MEHPIIESPSVAADPPTDEALRMAIGRLMLAILRAARVRELPMTQAIERIEQVAEIFEREVANARK